MIQATLDVPSVSEFRKLDREAQNVVRKALTKAIRVQWRAMKRRIEQTVRRPGPSAPGQPTAADEGEYGRSFRAQVRSRASRRGQPPFIDARLYNERWNDVGVRQEYGTRTLLPRPHLLPELERSRPIIETALGRAQYEQAVAFGEIDEEIL